MLLRFIHHLLLRIHQALVHSLVQLRHHHQLIAHFFNLNIFVTWPKKHLAVRGKEALGMDLALMNEPVALVAHR